MKQEHVALFEDRPPIGTAPCGRCRGTGRVTAGFRALAPDHSAPEVDGQVHAIALLSCSIYEAAHEAAEIAQRGDVEVVFDFNDREVVVRPDSDPNLVARRWWVAEYGMTPEETWANR